MVNTTLSVQIIRSQDLSADMYSEILSLCYRAYGQDLKPIIDTFHDATHIIGRLNGTLVTHALWVTRWLQTGDLPLLRTAFVEAVATEVDYQKKGFASLIMNRIIKEISEFDLAGLSTGSPGFYSRLGWEPWRGPLFIRTEGGLMPTPNDSVMVFRLPKTPAIDLDAPLSAEWREGELW
jgi:aminoglycoside 2'-N-acetyltransferase I